MAKRLTGFMDAVVAIGFRDGTASSPRWAATGFLYGKKASATEPIYTVALVTNRHVFDGERSACLRFNPEGKDAAKELWVDLEDRDGAPLWASDPSVDLAVVAIRVDQLISSRIRVVLFRNDQDTLCLKDAEKAGVTEGDGVAVLGFPLGLVGSQRNYTIVRQGSIARIRDAFAGVSNEILVDTAVFPGNSGGPVVTRPNREEPSSDDGEGRPKLIGVVSGYLLYEDVAVSRQTGDVRVVFQENSGLASVVPVDHIVRLFDENLELWRRKGVATAGPQPSQ